MDFDHRGLVTSQVGGTNDSEGKRVGGHGARRHGYRKREVCPGERAVPGLQATRDMPDRCGKVGHR